MLIQILDNFWLDVWSVTCIKKIDDKSCSLWVTGQGAMDGLVLDYPADEVAQAINDERKRGDSEPGDGEDGERDDE